MLQLRFRVGNFLISLFKIGLVRGIIKWLLYHYILFQPTIPSIPLSTAPSSAVCPPPSPPATYQCSIVAPSSDNAANGSMVTINRDN